MNFCTKIFLAVCLTVVSISTGCDRKETVLDVEGPNGGGLEVERDIDTGAVEVDVDDSH